MNKIQLSIYSALAFAIQTLNIYPHDISLFSIPSGHTQNSPKVIAEISIPAINHRDIPIRVFDITSCSIPKSVHDLNRSKKSVSTLSEWQIVLPIKEMMLTSNANSCVVTYEKLIYNFPDRENSFPNLLPAGNIEIVLHQKEIDPLHYSIQYAPFSLTDIRSRCIPSIQCSPLHIEKKDESKNSAPGLSLVPPFIIHNCRFSIKGALPSSGIPILSYNSLDKHMVKDILCFPRGTLCMDFLQEIELTNDLYIEPSSSLTCIDSFRPQLQLPIFSRHMQLTPEIILPVVHTSISKYIPSGLTHISMIHSQVNRPITFIGPFHYMENFALLPNLDDLRTISYRDEFASATSAMPSDTGEYFFSITLTPNEHIAFPPIPQTVFFLIDRSSHISAEQFNSFQRGVIRALPYLPSNSRFNIAFFDQKIFFLHPMDLEIGSESIHKASAFVRSSSKRLVFGSSDIYSALNKIQNEAPSIAHTSYILLTNRKSLQSGKNAQLLSSFIQDHREICTLYIASIGDNMIDIPNVEESLYSDTHATFPRRLASLVKNISFPIANHLKISAITEDPDLHIELSPNSHILHQDKPFIIYGKMDHLKNFQLILQGNSVNSWINITKPIVFTVPSHSTKALAKHFNKPEKSHL